jgi:hypothetical protein
VRGTNGLLGVQLGVTATKSSSLWSCSLLPPTPAWGPHPEQGQGRSSTYYVPGPGTSFSHQLTATVLGGGEFALRVSMGKAKSGEQAVQDAKTV